ncbi:type II secretion system protein M [Thalassotalea insulae]|uniref:Type II secretion system protein M n=1 Tax=Thalassotalea insulae TaxID=2056778 RepID=A0ABQ6GW33_9GAMM|nr:type II secretion system protein M [Thalassotalea insulae]GLX78920.1 type II secretion system protein M [Thalassotalea insulae]
MKAWWQQLNAREQQLVSALSAVLVIFILYSFIWQPLNNNIENGHRKLKQRQELLTWVTTQTLRYQSLKGNAVSKSTGSLSSIINRSAKAYDISIARIQPQSNDVQVWIDNIAFSQLLLWLEQLSNKEGIEVLNIDLTQGEQAGAVRVKRLQLGKS